MAVMRLWLATVAEYWDGDVPGCVVCLEQARLYDTRSYNALNAFGGIVALLAVGEECAGLLRELTPALVFQLAPAHRGVSVADGWRVWVEERDGQRWFAAAREGESQVVGAPHLRGVLAQLAGLPDPDSGAAVEYLLWRDASWPEGDTEQIRCLEQAPVTPGDPASEWVVRLRVQAGAEPVLRWISSMEVGRATEGVGSDLGWIQCDPHGGYIVEPWSGDPLHCATLPAALAVLRDADAIDAPRHGDDSDADTEQ